MTGAGRREHRTPADGGCGRELPCASVVGVVVMRPDRPLLTVAATTFAAWVGACLLSACGPATTTEPPPNVPAAPASAPTPLAAPTPPPDDPDETRCGVDDGPVRIGRADAESLRVARGPETLDRSRDDDFLPLFGRAGPPPVLGKRMLSEMMPEPPAPAVHGAPLQVAITFRGVSTDATAALTARASRCAEAAGLEDAGDSSIRVRLASSGTALATRTLTAKSTAGASAAFRKCLEAAACALKASPGGAPTAVEVVASVAVERPVFRGQVDVDVVSLDDQREGPPRGRRGRTSVVLIQRPKAAKAAFDAMVSKLRQAAQEVGRGCAEQLPPADAFTLVGDYTLAPGNATPLPSLPPPVLPESYEQRLHACLRDGFTQKTVPSKTGRPERLMVHWRFTEAARPTATP
jgi:hypothetical protein